VKRRRTLTPLAHDHQHALVAARRLRLAADRADASAEVAAFLRFFSKETVRHFREEEEQLFPLVVDSDEARPLVIRALLEHQQLHALARRLTTGETLPMRELPELLEAHVRFEERELFPMIERVLGDLLASVELGGDRDAPLEGRGPVWGRESEDLNATLLVWSAGEGPPEHLNDERDVLIFIVDGAATVAIGGEKHELGAAEALIVGKGLRRSVTAGPGGVRYLSVHLRRPPLQIKAAVGRGLR
jgi:quercetin dioxygenase-like cupin family protein/hemerythrin-like domain-containing protein